MLSIGAWSGCRTCLSYDPGSDTVEVDPHFWMSGDKENCVLKQQSAEQKEDEWRKGAIEQARYLERERLEHERAMEEAARLERERRETEAAEAAAERQVEMEQELREREEAEAEAFRQAEEERRLAAQAADESRQKEELAARQREADEQKQLQAFLKEHGFTGINEKRSHFFLKKSKYPLHCAVKYKDADMVRVMLKSGADPAFKSSAGLTPWELALKLTVWPDNKLSHDLVLFALTQQ